MTIEQKRDRDGMFKRCERHLRWVRQRVFDFEDQGRGEQAERVILKLKARLAPLWDARRNHGRSDGFLFGYD